LTVSRPIAYLPGPASSKCARRIIGFVTSADGCVEDGSLWTNTALGRLIEALRDECDRLLVAISGSPQRTTWHDYKTDIPTEDVIALDHMPSIAKGFFNGRSCRAVIREIEREAEVLIVQLPFSAPSALPAARRPRVYHVCADLPSVVKASKFYRGPRRVGACSLATLIDRLQRLLVKRKDTAVITNGEALWAKYGGPRGRFVVSSSIVGSDILSVGRQRAAGAPFRVLFVGYLRPEKGLDVLLDAYTKLRLTFPDAELQVIGTTDVVEHGAARELYERIATLQHGGAAITVHGHIVFGPALFSYYANADVLAVPSRSEGTPRVLVEARALGCPVVATRVGGIPSSVVDGVDGLLVPPDDPSALATALVRIARDPNLRRRLVEGGLEMARNTTVEWVARDIMDQVELLLGLSRRGTVSAVSPEPDFER
jgi:glycosyltransferase involved in cell wall biosynthesis